MENLADWLRTFLCKQPNNKRFWNMEYGNVLFLFAQLHAPPIDTVLKEHEKKLDVPTSETLEWFEKAKRKRKYDEKPIAKNIEDALHAFTLFGIHQPEAACDAFRDYFLKNKYHNTVGQDHVLFITHWIFIRSKWCTISLLQDSKDLQEVCKWMRLPETKTKLRSKWHMKKWLETLMEWYVCERLLGIEDESVHEEWNNYLIQRTQDSKLERDIWKESKRDRMHIEYHLKFVYALWQKVYLQTKLAKQGYVLLRQLIPHASLDLLRKIQQNTRAATTLSGTIEVRTGHVLVTDDNQRKHEKTANIDRALIRNELLPLIQSRLLYFTVLEDECWLRRKAFGDSGTREHADYYYYFKRPKTIKDQLYTLWTPLTPLDRAKGDSVLRILPHSHRDYTKHASGVQLPLDYPAKESGKLAWRFMDDLNIGDAVLFSIKTIHGADPHRNPHGTRISLDLRVSANE